MRDKDYIEPMSNGMRKKMMAREHNRAYNAGEPARGAESLTDSVKRIIQGFQEVVSPEAKPKKQKRWGK